KGSDPQGSTLAPPSAPPGPLLWPPPPKRPVQRLPPRSWPVRLCQALPRCDLLSVQSVERSLLIAIERLSRLSGDERVEVGADDRPSRTTNTKRRVHEISPSFRDWPPARPSRAG